LKLILFFNAAYGPHGSAHVFERCLACFCSVDDPAVHFYALRTLLRNPHDRPWDTPCEIHRMFPLAAKTDDLDRASPGSSSSGGGASSASYHYLLCGAGRTRGRRSYMEDVDFQFREIKVPHEGGNCLSLYGVLDGHGGQECAQHTSDELPTKLTAELRSKRPVPEALFTAYLKTDAEFIHIASDSQAGCTATVCVWDGANNRGYVANAGDTRAVMCRGGVAVDLTIDKKATDPYEIARIYREGGFVSNGRVMGTLGVARAIGDCSLKHTSKRILVSDPEVTTFDYQPNADQFMVIASDGLWDVMASQDAVNWIKAKLESHNIIKGRLLVRVFIVSVSTAPFLSV
jgi:serine/threonine protein phosphatase PrpC